MLSQSERLIVSDALNNDDHNNTNDDNNYTGVPGLASSGLELDVGVADVFFLLLSSFHLHVWF